ARHVEERRAGAEAERGAAVVLAEVDRLADVGVRLRGRFAGLVDLERGELGAPGAKASRGREQHGGAIAPGRGTPFRGGADRDLDRLGRLLRSGAATAADDGPDRARIDRDDLRAR